MRGASVHSTRSESRTLERGASSNCNSNSLNNKGVSGRRGLRWGTWNIGSYKGKDGELENVMEKRGLMACCFQETKQRGHGKVKCGNYNLYYQGTEDKKQGELKRK